MKAAQLLMIAGVLGLGTLVAEGQVVMAPAHPSPGPTTRTENRPQGVNAPVPAALTQAKTVFLSNGGADAGLFPHPFTGTQDRGFARFYSAMTASQRFSVVASPGDADLVLQFELLAPMGPLGNNKVMGTTDPLPTFKLTVYDRPSHYVLWALNQTIDPANKQKTHDKNFDDALDAVVAQLMMVAAK